MALEMTTGFLRGFVKELANRRDIESFKHSLELQSTCKYCGTLSLRIVGGCPSCGAPLPKRHFKGGKIESPLRME